MRWRGGVVGKENKGLLSIVYHWHEENRIQGQGCVCVRVESSSGSRWADNVELLSKTNLFVVGTRRYLCR